MLITCLFIISTTSEAAKIDAYRTALINKNFTIKYDVITPPIRQTNKEATIIQRYTFSPIEIANKRENQMRYSGILVVDGEDRYIEFINDKLTQYSGIQKVGICKLIKNGEVFNYYWDMKKDRKRYYGGRSFFGKSKSVKAISEPLNPYEAMFEKYNYGVPVLANALEAILPPDKIIAAPNKLQYKFLGSGDLSDGLTYEDFVGSKDNLFSAIRYYFNGNDLVKIATVNFTEVNDQILDYEKSVIAITEFSMTADKNYLSLPSGLKDKTRRNKQK